MAYNAQRRFYRLGMGGATCFLMGVLLSQADDTGIVNFQLYLAYILVFVGIILCFKAFETIIYSEENPEYTYEEDTGGNVERPYEEDAEYDQDVQIVNLP